MKRYNKPTIQIVRVETVKMLAKSVGISSTSVKAEEAESRSMDWDEE